MINASISNALLPLQQQLLRISTSGNESASLQSLRQQQRLLSIDTQSAALATPGGKSQYRYLARIQLFLENTMEALDKFENGESDIETVRQHVSSATSFTSERIGLILKADAEPKYGWKAFNLYEEKMRQSSTAGCISDPETNKTWASCLKTAQALLVQAGLAVRQKSSARLHLFYLFIHLFFRGFKHNPFAFQFISAENKRSFIFSYISFLV